ncbi:hypothetical protein LG951_05215 [Bacillus pumilus]|uniref:hypothetical protein n=1 Tax=Bacillus pumilus TaxID=1408 RepID=UPI001D014736|nr:hypothetical protein [Bacillus pumilus]UDF17591.1 hypothetical protein LG951_05215 [Bacillus pumilus]
MSKKKKTTTNNKQKNEQKNEQLKELEDVIYTYQDEELLSYFTESFKHGKEKEHYKKYKALLYNLDIECLEFAVTRFSNIDDSRDPSRRNLIAIIPLFLAFLTVVYSVNENKWVGFGFVTIAILIAIALLDTDRKKRKASGYMLKTFEQVKARKEKLEERNISE